MARAVGNAPLEELVERIERGADLLPPEERAAAAEGGEELTNEDFFWDM